MSGRGKEVWLEAGMALLVDRGPEGLTIERLCANTSKSKGSFYHHFRSVADFQKRLLEYWEQAHTESLIAATNSSDAKQGLRDLARLADSLLFSRESAFRTWAARDTSASEVVRRVDAARVAHLGRLRGESGDETLAWLEYAVFLGLAQLGDSITPQQRKDARRLFARKVMTHD